MLYDERTAEAVGRCVATQVARSGGVAIVADPGRPGGRAAFLRGASAAARGSGPFAERLRFEEEPLPRQWCGASASASVGICQIHGGLEEPGETC